MAPAFVLVVKVFPPAVAVIVSEGRAHVQVFDAVQGKGPAVLVHCFGGLVFGFRGLVF